MPASAESTVRTALAAPGGWDARPAHGPRLLVSQVRRVPVGTPVEPGEPPLDLRLRDGVVVQVAARLTPAPGEPVLRGEGRWAIPGLWDQHVHLGQWAATAGRLDLRATTAPEEVLATVAAALADPARDESPDSLLVGFGHRAVAWSRSVSVAELDAATGRRPVVLISGDAHSGWLNSAALRLLGLPAVAGPITEREWFAAMPRLDGVTGSPEHRRRQMVDVVAAAHRRGVVGVTDFEWEAGHVTWPERFGPGLDTLRVRTGVYPDQLEDVLGRGLRTGQTLPGTGGMVELGPLKVISDGSLGTRTAFCCNGYHEEGGATQDRGATNYSRAQLVDLLRRARSGGLRVAVHAIGDAAATTVLDAFEATGARGSIEHAQLMTWDDVARMAGLGLTASVQPAHLLDDRDLIDRYWPDRADRCFALAALRRAGVRLTLGSDAPVAPLDPWLAIAAAVARTDGRRPAWHPEQAISVAEALAASTDGATTLEVGSRADLVLLDADPLADADPGRLAGMPVDATVVGGRVVHCGV